MGSQTSDDAGGKTAVDGPVAREIFAMNTTMSPIDWAIIGIYLCGVVGLGVAAGFLRRKGERGAGQKTTAWSVSEA